jgi:hypothetical protein
MATDDAAGFVVPVATGAVEAPEPEPDGLGAWPDGRALACADGDGVEAEGIAFPEAEVPGAGDDALMFAPATLESTDAGALACAEAPADADAEASADADAEADGVLKDGAL